MKQTPQFTKEQLELIIASLAFTSFDLSSSDNLALSLLDIDHAFEFYGLTNPIDKRKLITEPCDYVDQLFAPVMKSVQELHEVANQ